jgi:hypothetical protein
MYVVVALYCVLVQKKCSNSYIILMYVVVALYCVLVQKKCSNSYIILILYRSILLHCVHL